MITQPTFPLSVWEQIAVVAVFSVVFLAFIGGCFAALMSIVKQFSTITDAFQSTLLKVGEQFQERNSAVVNAINQLLVEFKQHDARTVEAVEDMRQSQDTRNALLKETADAAKATALLIQEQSKRNGTG